MTTTLTELRGALDALPPGKRPPPRLRAAISAAFDASAQAALSALASVDHRGWKNLSAATDCPWSPDDVKTMPWLGGLPSTLEKELRKRCLGLVTKKINGRWHLGYALELGTQKQSHWRIDIFVGGPPSEDPQLNKKALALKWRVPDALRPLYATHDGLGSHGGSSFATGALLPAAKLDPLPARIGHTHQGQPIIESNAFLSFYRDDDDRCLGIYRQGSNAPYVRAFAWNKHDRGVTQLSKPVAVITKVLIGVLRA